MGRCRRKKRGECFSRRKSSDVVGRGGLYIFARELRARATSYRRPVFDYCSPDVPLSRLMELVQGAREWTGEDIEPWPNVDGCEGAGIVYLSLRDPFRRPVESERLYEFGQWPPGTPLEVAIILACLGACVVYGEKRV